MTSKAAQTSSRTILGAVTVASSVVASVPACVVSAYLAGLTIVAWRNSGRLAPTADVQPRHRFLVVVPAHDEEAMIARTVQALVDQRYPTDAFEVHVIADNCSDGTAAEAERAGAQAHIRSDRARPGKGAAINWLLDSSPARYDVVTIIDADTIADPNFLLAMNQAFANGAEAAQGYYGVAAPETSSSVGLRYAALACRHHLRPLARTALGASCGLYGNGMAFRRDVIEGRRWSSHLVEDAEFQMELLLDGVVVTYAPNARLVAEMPDSLRGATTQNERWELGRLQLIRRYVPPLVRRAVRGGPLRRGVYADALADHLTPPITVLALLDMLTVGLSGAALALRPTRLARCSFVGGVACSAVLVAHVLAGLRLVNAPQNVYRSLASAPRAVLWKLGLLTRIVRRPHDVTWTRTARNESAGAR